MQDAQNGHSKEYSSMPQADKTLRLKNLKTRGRRAQAPPSVFKKQPHVLSKWSPKKSMMHAYLYPMIPNLGPLRTKVMLQLLAQRCAVDHLLCGKQWPFGNGLAVAALCQAKNSRRCECDSASDDEADTGCSGDAEVVFARLINLN